MSVPPVRSRHRAWRGRPAEAAAAITAVLLSVVGLGAQSLGARAQGRFATIPPSQPGLSRVGSTSAGAGASAVGDLLLPVSELERSVHFYTSVLAFQEEGHWASAGDVFERTVGLFGAQARSARLRLGEEHIVLIQYQTPAGRPIPPDSRSNDRWFQHAAIAVSDMARAVEALREHGVRSASSGPQTLPSWNQNAGGISAFYFKDPDDHVLEIIHFPLGKGDSRWQAQTTSVFLGIDHTAIAVEDTERSLAFYRDVLGLRVVGGSENYGIEQEHLNNVFGARLRITTLRAAGGPGIELLEYLSPSSGRDYPRDSTASDLWQWQTTLRPPDPEIEVSLRKTRARWVSAAPASPAQPLQSFIVRDPDGHAIAIDPPAAAPAASSD